MSTPDTEPPVEVLNDDELRAVSALAEICQRLADEAGMEPMEVYESQFEGRDYRVSISVDEDGTETTEITFLDDEEPES